ncbi:MAG TPA: hypothetical protein VM536_02210 [Chloroflexia bacterium]|nr:hypothetical protein [Chloroflexia bacterium]
MREYEGWDLWWHWVRAHALGALAGVPAAAVLGIPFLFVCGYYGLAISALMGGLVCLLAVAGAEQMVLWPYASLAWLRNTVLGTLAAIPLAAVSAGPLDALGWARYGAVAGAVVGLAQWPLLRAGYARAAVWVPAQAGGWALGLVAARALLAPLLTDNGPHVTSDQIFWSFALGILAPTAVGALAATIAAVVTGGALFWIQAARVPAPAP